MNNDSPITEINSPHVAVIGGGVIGVCCALALQKAGRQVVLIERDSIAAEASAGNAGHIGTEQVYPVASPDVLKDLPKMLLDPLGPLRIDFRYLPQLTPWFICLLLNLRPKPFAASCQALQQINAQALDAWQRVLKSEQLTDFLHVNGTYMVSEKPRSITAMQAKIPTFDKLGIATTWLDKKALQDQLPLLNQQQLGGLFFPDTAHVVCPKTLCHALHQRFTERGGQTVIAGVQSVSDHGDNVSITLEHHEKSLIAQQALIACGVFSKPLVKSASGITPPLQAERGYHLMIQPPKGGLDAPIISFDRRFIMTPLQHGIRLGGTVEFAALNAKPNYQRATNLLTLANGMLREPLQRTEDDPWLGLRPTLPDSLPVIDRVGRVAYAFGHQHLGLTQAAVTAEWITQLMTDGTPTADLQPYRLNRFN